MKTLKLILALWLLSMVRPVSAAALTVCRVNDAPGILLRFSYPVDHAPIAWYHYAEGAYWSSTSYWGGEAVLTDYARGFAEYSVLDYGDRDYQMVHGDRTTPFCLPAGDNLPTITLWDVRGNLFTWEIQDEWGNWHEVRDSAGMVYTPVEWAGDVPFTRLVLGHDNPVLDPLRYRIEVVG